MTLAVWRYFKEKQSRKPNVRFKQILFVVILANMHHMIYFNETHVRFRQFLGLPVVLFTVLLLYFSIVLYIVFLSMGKIK